jgi:hypothetical protein
MNSSAHEWNMLSFSESFNLSTQLSFLLKSQANIEGGGHKWDVEICSSWVEPALHHWGEQGCERL